MVKPVRLKHGSTRDRIPSAPRARDRRTPKAGTECMGSAHAFFNHHREGDMTNTLLSEMNIYGSVPNINLIKQMVRHYDKECLDMSNCNKEAPIHIAVMHGWIDVVQLLVERGADIDNTVFYGITPLNLAVTLHAYSIAEFLLSAGANVNLKRPYCYSVVRGIPNAKLTPLFSAVECRWRNINGLRLVELLLRYGADVNVKTDVKETPLHAAAICRNDNIIWLLANAGADINAVDEYGETPIHKAAVAGGYWTCKTLVELGANINAKSTGLYKVTPLYNLLKHLSSVEQAEGIETARGLIELGADPDIPCYRNVTPRKLAKRLGIDL